jgi:microcystin-dependent protein
VSYTYTPGQGLAALNQAEPADTDLVSNSAAESLQQVKAYLKDLTVGPDAKLKVLSPQVAAFATSQSSDAFPGIIMEASSVLSGWLECNGAVVSRTTYSALFSSIGVTYGPGDGTTTFNLPDLRGKLVCGTDLTQSICPRAIAGATFGSLDVTLTLPQFPTHSHKSANPADLNFFAERLDAAHGSTVDYLSPDTYTSQTGAPIITSRSLLPLGGGLSHNNVMPVLVNKFIIKT